MYMTVYKCDKASAAKTAHPLDLSDGNAVHRWISGRLGRSRQEGKILFCVQKEYQAMYLYVQSDVPMQEAENRGMVFVRQFPVEDSLRDAGDGDTIVFDVLVSPQHEVNNRRVYIADPGKRDAWIRRKLEEGGLRCADLSEESRENIRFVKDGRNIRIPCSRYTGFGVITDKAKLLSLLADGLGKNKCYGAGLMFAMPATAY